MAYQNVGSPRFYINDLEWLDSVDAITLPSEHYRTLPVNPQVHSTSDDFNFPYSLGNPFLFMLGHWGWGTSGYYETDVGLTGELNINGDANPEHDGWSLVGLDGTPSSFVSNVGIGSIIIGSYYDMPNAPNLSLIMSREYGGTKEFTTYNGGSMSNTMWSKPPKWGDLGAWELGDSNPSLSKSGRRTWDLKFSYMDDGDLWGSNQSLGMPIGDTLSASEIALYDGGIGGDLANNTTFNYDLLTDDNFFSQVWHKTLGGTLPFIFQPDGGANGNNNPDQFAICRFKDNSLKATQSAFNVYDISLSIEEVW